MEGELSFKESRRQVQIQYRNSKPGLWLFVVPIELTRVSEAVEANSGIYFHPGSVWEK